MKEDNSRLIKTTLDAWRLAEEGDPKNAFPLLFNWAWIGTQLAQGALNWAGASALEALLKRPGGGTLDLASLLAEWTESVRRVTRDEIDRARLGEAQARVDSAKRQWLVFQDTVRNGTPKLELLTQSLQDSTGATSSLHALRRVASHAYPAAQGLHLNLLRDGITYGLSTKETLKREAANGADHLREMQKSWQQWVKDKVGPVVRIRSQSGKRFGFRIEGRLNVPSPNGSRAVVERARQGRIADLLSQYQHHWDPLTPIIKKFQKIGSPARLVEAARR